jgi:acyl-coenzyme A thioesterase PaaI-like protein
MIKFISTKTVLKIISFWPPFLASGISVKSVNDDFTEVTVKMVQRFYNTNYVGTHFGGSLYSMCDPFYMFILLHHLHIDHIVWDKAAKVDFIKPGKGTVTAKFSISFADIEKIKSDAKNSYSVKPEFTTTVIDSSGEVVAKVVKTLYVRRKVSQIN